MKALCSLFLSLILRGGEERGLTCNNITHSHLDAAPDGDGQRDDDQHVGEEGDQRTADAAVLYTVSNTLGQQQRGLTSSSWAVPYAGWKFLDDCMFLWTLPTEFLFAISSCKVRVMRGGGLSTLFGDLFLFGFQAGHRF